MRCVSANMYVQVRYSEIKNDERKNFKNNQAKNSKQIVVRSQCSGGRFLFWWELD